MKKLFLSVQVAGGGLNWGNQEGRPPFDDSSFKGEYKLSTLSYDGALYRNTNYTTYLGLQQHKYPAPPPTPSTPLHVGVHILPLTFQHAPTSSNTSTSHNVPSSSLSCPISSMPTSRPRSTLNPSPLSLYSSYQQLQISSVRLSCQESAKDNHTQRFFNGGSGQEYEALLRRGNTLTVCVTTSLPLSSPYTLTLTFISGYHSNDRFGQFRAKGTATNSPELWFSITLPSNFPVGKFHYHVHLSSSRGKDVATYYHNKPVAVLFSPWHPDDDAYLESEDDIEKHLVNEVGTIWRGTARQPHPLIWEYGQYAAGCLDVALQLLRGLSADERRNAATISKCIVAQVNSCDGHGVMKECYSGTYTGGVAPCRWNGSTAILQRFHRSQQPVRYGQCWVLAGVTITLLRALGVVCRPITCYEAAHHCSKPGQLDLAFTPQGEMLDDATHDQLWVYHVWVEAWMRRDDLSPGHDAWQILDPTSRQQQGGLYRVGPVPVTTVKERVCETEGLETKGEVRGQRRKGGQDAVRVRGGEKRSSNGAQYVVSEVNADLRFLRVSKSYASITNRVLSVALVRHNDIGVRLVAGDGTSLEPHSVTEGYKRVELFNEATPTHRSPTRDCTVEVSTDNSSKLGEQVTLTVTVTNHGHLLRTMDGKVEGHIVRYCGIAVREFVSMQFSGVVAPGQSASVDVAIEARQYMKQLVEQCMMQFFVAVKARESGQLFLKVHHYQPQLPSVEVRCDECPVTLGKVIRVKITFRNNLSRSLSRLLFLVQAQGLCAQRELPYRRMVLPGGLAKVEFPVRATSPGTYYILASLHCDQLIDIHGWTKITVLPPPTPHK